MSSPSEPALTAFVGLGSNVGARASTCLAAVRRLAACEGVRVDGVSSAWESAPWGDIEQPPFVNAVACLVVTGPLAREPAALLDALHAVEGALGRDRARERRWGPRPLDLDLLLFGDRAVSTPACVVPHPELERRRFVLEPLAERWPTAALPDGRRADALLAVCADPLWVRRLGALEAVAAAEE